MEGQDLLGPVAVEQNHRHIVGERPNFGGPENVVKIKPNQRGPRSHIDELFKSLVYRDIMLCRGIIKINFDFSFSRDLF